MTDVDDLEACYFDLTGDNFSFLSDNSIPKTEFPSLVLFYDTVYYDVEETINYFINDYRKASPAWDSLYPHMKSFFDLYTAKVFGNKEYLYFFELCAKVYLSEYKILPELQNYGLELFGTPIKDTAFVDLISGFNFINFYDFLDENIIYYLIDKSIMTCTCLEQERKRKNIGNVVILNCDIKDVNKNQIEKDVSVVRANNIWRYVEDFHLFIEKYTSMIIPGGIFLFQEYSKYKLFFTENNPYQTRNISSYFDNWEQSCIIDLQGKKIFDSLVFERKS